VAAAPAARVPARSPEPPAWLDEAPFEEKDASMDSRASTPPSLDDEPGGNAPTASGRIPAPAAPVAPPAPALVPTELGERWAQLVGQMAEAGCISALARELAMQSECIAVQESAAGGAVWRLRVEREMLRAPAHRDKVQAALAEALGHPVELVVELGVAVDSPALRAAALRLRRQAEAEQIIQNDPLVQSLMQQFKTARIVPGSVRFH